MANYIYSAAQDSYGCGCKNYNNPASTIEDYGCGCDHDHNNCSNDQIGSNSGIGQVYGGNDYYRNRSGGACECCPLFYVIIALLIIMFLNR